VPSVVESQIRPGITRVAGPLEKLAYGPGLTMLLVYHSVEAVQSTRSCSFVLPLGKVAFLESSFKLTVQPISGQRSHPVHQQPIDRITKSHFPLPPPRPAAASPYSGTPKPDSHKPPTSYTSPVISVARWPPVLCRTPGTPRCGMSSG